MKKCPECEKYTLKDKHCKKDTIEVGYKFIKVSDAPKQEEEKESESN